MTEQAIPAPKDSDGRKELERSTVVERFLHPQSVGIEGPIPTGGPKLYELLDSGNTPLEGIGAIVRNRYPDTAAIVDRQFEAAETRYWAATDDEDARDSYKQALGVVGAYNYIRGMKVFTSEGSVDRAIAPKMMLSPSAGIQVLQEANITPDDKVLDLFCGTGYSTFYWAVNSPARLDAVDKYTAEHYRLEETFDTAYSEVFAPLPEDIKPTVTKPNFLMADGTTLPKFDSADGQKQGFADGYDKIFLHPPYGRESTRLIPDVSEAEAFMLWVNSIIATKKANDGKGNIFSVVPAEWKDTIKKIQEGVEPSAAIEGLYAQLRELRYYQFPENSIKLDTPYNLDTTNNWSQQSFQDVFKDSLVKPLEETGMFGLDLHSIK